MVYTDSHADKTLRLTIKSMAGAELVVYLGQVLGDELSYQTVGGGADL